MLPLLDGTYIKVYAHPGETQPTGKVLTVASTFIRGCEYAYTSQSDYVAVAQLWKSVAFRLETDPDIIGAKEQGIGANIWEEAKYGR